MMGACMIERIQTLNNRAADLLQPQAAQAKDAGNVAAAIDLLAEALKSIKDIKDMDIHSAGSNGIGDGGSTGSTDQIQARQLTIAIAIDFSASLSLSSSSRSNSDDNSNHSITDDEETMPVQGVPPSVASASADASAAASAPASAPAPAAAVTEDIFTLSWNNVIIPHPCYLVASHVLPQSQPQQPSRILITINQLSLSIIYNMALSLQLQAIQATQQQQQQQTNQALVLAGKALELYHHAQILLLSSSSHSNTNTNSNTNSINGNDTALHVLYLTVNIGHVNRMLDCDHQAIKCYEQVLSLLMYVATNRPELQHKLEHIYRAVLPTVMLMTQTQTLIVKAPAA